MRQKLGDREDGGGWREDGSGGGIERDPEIQNIGENSAKIGKLE